MRFRLWAGITLGISGMVALAVVVPAAAASSTPEARFMAWKPGTPLPKTAPGMVWLAESPGNVLVKLKPGQMVPLVAPSKGVPNKAGYVDLVEDPVVVHGSDPGSCVRIVHKDLGAKATSIASTWMTRNKLSTVVTYTEGSGSTLGIGFSWTGKKGSFSLDGSDSVSSAWTEYYPTVHGPNFTVWQTFFDYDEMKSSCGQHDIVGVAYAGGQWKWRPKKAPKMSKCEPQLAHSAVRADSTRAETFSGGFTVPALGFTGTAQTGWSTDTSVWYGWGVSGHVCGSSGYPPESPIVLAN